MPWNSAARLETWTGLTGLCRIFEKTEFLILLDPVNPVCQRLLLAVSLMKDFATTVCHRVHSDLRCDRCHRDGGDFHRARAPTSSRSVVSSEALLGIGTALAISVGFMFLGKLVFRALGITVADFQVAGRIDPARLCGPRLARYRRGETLDDRVRSGLCRSGCR